MLKRTITGKYKEKKTFNWKKFFMFFLKVFISILIILILGLSIYFGLSWYKDSRKTVSELYKEENYQRIVTLYDKQSNILTGTKEENLQIAKSLYLQDRHEDSVKVYKTVLDTITIRDINKSRILYDYVQPVIKLGKIDEAFTILEEAILWADMDINLAKNLRRIYGFLVASKPTEDNLKDGIKYLHEYIKYDLDNKDWEANYYLALLLYYASNYEDAINYSVRTIQINPNCTKAKHLIPKIYYEASEYEKAIESLKALNKVEINNIENYILMGRCYEILRDWSNVKATYNKVLEFDENNEEAHMGLVRCYTLQHDTNALVQHLYRIKDLDFSQENKDIIQVLLEQTVPTVVAPSKIDYDKLK